MGKRSKDEKRVKKDKKEKKIKKSKSESSVKVDQEAVQLYLSPVASPMAQEDLCKQLLKLTSKATKEKNVRRGVKEVVKALRKQQEGICLIAGDISPVDVITHLPVLCDEASVPYVYVPSKEQLGLASHTKRPTSCVMVSSASAYEDLYGKCTKSIKTL